MVNTCKLVHELKATREQLLKFAQAASNIELAAANTPYHRESAYNPFQVELVEQLRQRYIEAKGDPNHEVVVRKYKLPSTFEWKTTNSAQRIVLVNGLYRPDQPNHVDFANKNIGGGFLTYGMAQEEVMCVERADFGMLVAMMYAKNKNLTIEDDEAMIISGACYRCCVDFYGRVPENFDERSRFFAEPVPYQKGEGFGTLVAIDCIRPKWKRYTREHLEWCIKKAYCGFQAAKGNEITTGQWGCGAFFNNKHVMFTVQAIAAWMAGKKLLYHARHFHISKGMELLKKWGMEKTPVDKCIDELARRCEEDPDFETAYDPDLVQEAFEEVALAGNLTESTASVKSGETGETGEEPEEIVRDRIMPVVKFEEYAEKKFPEYGKGAPQSMPGGKGKGKGSERTFSSTTIS